MQVYGYINGTLAETRDDYVKLRRGIDSFKDDNELMEYAKSRTGNWYMSNGAFINFHLHRLDMEEPYCSLTEDEYKTLLNLQNKAKQEFKDLQKQLKIKNFEGTPLTEEQVIKFLDFEIEKASIKYGKDSKQVKDAEECKRTKLAKFRKGEVIEVASENPLEDVCDGFGGDKEILKSDGTIICDFFF